MSVPGKPICAAKRAKLGEERRPCNRMLFEETNRLRSAVKTLESRDAASSLQMIVWISNMVRAIDHIRVA